MKITPIEIRQKDFEKAFRGYNKEEVSAFLEALSKEWEKMLDENREAKFKLDFSEKEVKKLREVENSLYKTLKTAEDTGTNLVEQARKDAAITLKEARMESEALLKDARSQAKAIIEKAEIKSRNILQETQNEIKSLEKECKTMENQRDNLIAEIRSIANETLDKLTRIETKNSRQLFNAKIKETQELIDDLESTQEKNIEEKSFENTKQEVEKNTKKSTDSDNNLSFFDQIGH